MNPSVSIVYSLMVIAFRCLSLTVVVVLCIATFVGFDAEDNDKVRSDVIASAFEAARSEHSGDAGAFRLYCGRVVTGSDAEFFMGVQRRVCDGIRSASVDVAGIRSYVVWIDGSLAGPNPATTAGLVQDRIGSSIMGIASNRSGRSEVVNASGGASTRLPRLQSPPEGALVGIF